MDSQSWHKIIDAQNPEIIWDWLTKPQRKLLVRLSDGNVRLMGGQWKSYNFLVVYGLVFGNVLKPFGHKVLEFGKSEG